MIDILNHIDDVKKIRKLIVLGATIAHNLKKVNEFEKWLDEESKKSE